MRANLEVANDDHFPSAVLARARSGKVILKVFFLLFQTVHADFLVVFFFFEKFFLALKGRSRRRDYDYDDDAVSKELWREEEILFIIPLSSPSSLCDILPCPLKFGPRG